MPFIDADSHVLETEETWSYLRPHEAHMAPPALDAQRVVNNRSSRFWLLEGRLSVRGGQWIDGVFAPGAPDLSDVQARIRHMDELGVDIQVLIPTIFISAVWTHPEVEVALKRSYNRWLANVYEQSGGRLRWAIAVPTLSLDAAREELEFGREHGGVSVFMRGIEAERHLGDPYFYPLYEAAEALDLAISIHIGVSTAAIRELGGLLGLMEVPDAFNSLAISEVPARFPKLRFGFLEAGSMWVPSVIHRHSRAIPLGSRRTSGGQEELERLRNLPFYVTCQYDEDISHVIQYLGEDHLVIGTDYGHYDHSSDLEVPRLLGEREDLSPALVRKILYDNPKALYGLEAV